MREIRITLKNSYCFIQLEFEKNYKKLLYEIIKRDILLHPLDNTDYKSKIYE